MRRTFLIALREFLENVRTKGFWFGILLFPVLITVSGFLPGFLTKKATSTRQFVVLDPAGRYLPLLAAAIAQDDLSRQKRAQPAEPTTDRPPLASANSTDLVPPHSPVIRSRFRLVPLPAAVAAVGDFIKQELALRPYLSGEHRKSNGLFAAIVIPPDFRPGSTTALRYWSANQADTDLRDLIESTLRAEFRRYEYARLGLDSAVITQTEAIRVPVSILNPAKASGSEQVGLADQLTQWAPSAFVYLLWVAIFAVSQMLLNSVIEEKSNRLIEVLLSSVTPGQFMMGKLLGIAAVGSVMLSAWLGSLFSVALWQSQAAAAQAGAGSAMSELPGAVIGLAANSWLLPAFAFYFVCGYLLYAGIFLTIGSLCNTIKEAQNLMGPMMLILMVPLFLMPFIPRDPNGPLASVLSWVPLYTPFVMMNRVAAHPPLWEVIGTTAVLLSFIALVLWGCGRIFRLAILRTGQPPRLAELFRWLRTNR